MKVFDFPKERIYFLKNEQRKIQGIGTVKEFHLVAALILLFFFSSTTAQAQWGWRYVYPQTPQRAGSSCSSGNCLTPAKEPKKEEPEAKEEEEKRVVPESAETLGTLSITRTRFFAPSIEVADECDRILDRLEERYGKPKAWKPFPIYFQHYRGNGIAGYTLYQNGTVARVVCYEPLASAKGGTLDHELTHAFFFYFLDSNFDLFLNEGLAQNSEYRRRESLRQTVYRRYNNGEFWDIANLYGRNAYDNALRIYHQGFSFVDFLVARGGSQWLASFMTELVRTNDVDATLYRYYGYRNLKEAQRAWLDYVIYGQNRQSVEAIH
jgi:hypothetical protein